VEYLRPEFADPLKVHIDENFDVLTGFHNSELFYNCVFDKINDVTFRNCVLNQSRFITSNIEDALRFTITLDCFSFGGVELSPLIFDLILCLLVKGKGNTEKRRQLISVIGRERFSEIMTAMKVLE
jgi:hypothetical protein